ncbi:hypothetical protein U27_02927 [Candidatus Vecturithrix granuli]|uniref:DUF262 domain-containing protein n=1 Tax=Vecturithrix granuli TaxID=1499967 RepID=A0A081BUG1_VECG1|nr:hypothetical protein U27_02927 [Candidatus Vecturithrix granuli]
MENATQSKTDSIKNIIDGIVKKDIVLPEFQRDFVWDIGKTYDLFDSLIKDVFIGSIIYGIPAFEVTVRELDDRPRQGEGSRRKLALKSYLKEEVDEKVQTGNFRLILDGQQRLTSLYRALKKNTEKAIDDVWFIVKDHDGNGNVLEFQKRRLDELLHEFAGQESEDYLSIRLSDAYEIMEKGYRESVIRREFFNKLHYIQDKTSDEQEKIFDKYLIVSDKLRDLFKSEKLVSYYLLNTNSEKFALFFERSNSKGIQLSFIDILAAKLYAGFNLRQHIEEFEETHGTYTLNREIIVRTIAYIVSQRISKRRDIDRSYILSELKHEHFTEYWDAVCKRYRKTLDFLYKNHFILSQSWMPYDNMLIPLMVFLKEIGDDFALMDEQQFRFIKFWYWASIFAQRYTGSSNEMIIKDAEILTTIAHHEKIIDRTYFFRLRTQLTTYDELYSFSKKRSVIYRGILNLINYHAKGIVDWKNTSKLDFNSKLEDHHIFPQHYLKTKYKDDEDALELIDSVINRTLIPKMTNITIGKKPPSQYLQQLQASNPHLAESLKFHLIPEDLMTGMYDDFYLDFVEERAKAIFELIKILVIDARERIIEEFHQEPHIVGGIDTSAIEEDDEDENSHEPISSQAKGKLRRKAFVQKLQILDIHLTHLEKRFYKTKTEKLVGMTFASELKEKPGKWFLGLPERDYKFIVLLCEKYDHEMLNFVFPEEFLQNYMHQFSRSGSNLKFIITLKNNRYYLFIPTIPDIDVNRFLNNFELLKR